MLELWPRRGDCWRAPRPPRLVDLFREFGSAIRVEVVGLDSPIGVWLGIRHWIGKGFAIIVDGREVVRGSADYAPVRDAVAGDVQAHAAVR